VQVDEVRSQASIVHGSPSAQSASFMHATHSPPLHTPAAHGLPSEASGCVHAPATQTSSVHSSPSSQGPQSEAPPPPLASPVVVVVVAPVDEAPPLPGCTTSPSKLHAVASTATQKIDPDPNRMGRRYQARIRARVRH
jgi:hypothetical protein